MLGVTNFYFLQKTVLFPSELIFVTLGKFLRKWFIFNTITEEPGRHVRSGLACSS